MARIRTIKPEFCQSEKVGRLSRDARLLFVQLWPFVDDHGRCRGSSRLLAGILYPYDDDAIALIDGWLAELEREVCIRRYAVDGQTYLDIPNWNKHQRVDNAGKSQIPEYSPQLAASRREPPQLAANGGGSPLYLVPSTIGPSTLCAVANATRTAIDQAFDEFWKEAKGSRGKARNPKHPARLKFFALVKAGVDPAAIIAGLRRYLADMRAAGKFGTEFVAMAVTWLNQRSFEDYTEAIPPSDRPAYLDAPPGMQSYEDFRREYDAQREAAIREDTGGVEGGADQSDELQSTGGGPLRRT